jgi:hypothetical protein
MLKVQSAEPCNIHDDHEFMNQSNILRLGTIAVETSLS